MDIIKFPGLGIEIPISRVAFSLLGKPIYFYGIIIGIGIILALWFITKLGKKEGIKEDVFLDILLYGLPSAIIFARLYFVIFSWDLYKDNPISSLYIWEGGIAIYGALIGGIISTVIYCRVKKLNLLKIFDICSFGLLIGQAVGRWGNFVNQEAFGSNTTLPFGMWSEKISSYLFELKQKGMDVNPMLPVHPTFLYESLWNFFGIFVLLIYRKFFKKFDGELFILYIAWYGLGRGFIEGLRLDSLMLLNVRISQFIAFLSVFVAIYIIVYIRIFNKNKFLKED